jgi:hypothetical protein
MDSVVSREATPRLGSREAERVVFRAVIGARDGHHRLSAEVVDLSVTGVRLRTLNPVRLGQTFWLTLPTLDASEVRVVWVEGCLSGCTFSQPLAPCVLRAVIDASRSANDPAGHTDRRAVYRV